MAQLVARTAGGREVAGSSPVTPTIDILYPLCYTLQVMPKAPEYTRKEQKQRHKQWVREAHEEGARQEFPGAPIWNDWLVEQHKAKKREVGLPRRIGRAALEKTAESVLIAKEIPRALTDARHKNSARNAQRLQRAVGRSNSAEAIPKTDLRVVEKSRLRRLGRGVISTLDNSNKKALERTSQQTEYLANKARAKRQANRGPVEAWASNKIGKIDRKRQEKHLLRQKQFEAEKQVAWNKYLDENPEVEKQLIAEQEQRDKQFEVNARYESYNQMQGSASFATEHFVNRNSYSFSKALPRRPQFEGSYDELAKSSVERAAKNRQEDGSITLFSPNSLASVVKERLSISPDTAERDGPAVYDGETRYTSQNFYNRNRELRQEVQDRYDYTGGVATSLWKMGFVEFESEESIPYGRGEFNPDIEWSRDEDGTTFASLAYNPENELHRIIGGGQADPSSARIQLAINDSQRYAPEMSVSLIEQPALVHAA